MKKLSFIVLSLALLTTVACNNVGFKKTKSGLMYKIMSKGNPAAVKRGEWLKLHIRQTMRDSLLTETYGNMPVYIQSDSFPAAYDPREVIPMLRAGDSAVVVLMADSIFKRQGGLPEFMKRSDKLVLTLKVLDVYTSDSLKMIDENKEIAEAQAKQSAESEGKKASTIKDIEKYLDSTKTVYQKAPGGTYVVITEPGTGPKCDTGKTAFVLYRGKLFRTGQQFDTNMDGGKQAYPVKVGAASVIKGWDEGLPYFAKGGKGILYVPFFQGYGPQAGPLNTPYANMVFDIEITDVQEGEPAPAPPPPAPKQ